MKGVVFGHSIVTSLRDHLNNAKPSHGHLSPVQIAHSLRTDKVVESLDLIGIRGLKVMIQNFAIPFHRINVTLPDFVILKVGSNYLGHTDPSPLARKLIQTAEELLEIENIKMVTICSLLRRDDRNIGQDKSFHKTYVFNNILKEFCDKSKIIKFHRHEGFGTPITKWTKDGIHPNSPLGRKNYKRSIRSAAFRTVTAISKL